MKKIILGLGMFGIMASTVFSQGLVSISLPAGSLVSTNTGTGTSGRAYGNGTYRFELLVSTNLATPAYASDILFHPEYLSYWTDSGVTGVSLTASINAGKISAGASVAANGVPVPTNGGSYGPAVVMIVVGWSTAEFGSSWSSVTNAFLNNYLVGGYFGTTAVATNYGGGGPSSLPAVNVWGNQTGISGAGINSALVLGLGNPLAYDFFIFQQPTNQTIPLGGNGVVSIGAGGAPINYQWRFNGTNLPGATSSSYQITNMNAGNVGDYSVVLANILNTQTSAVAHVTIRAMPSISQQPTNGQAFPVGTTASLTVGAVGDASLSYQWRSSTSPATLGTDPTLSFPLAQTNNSGSYFVIVTNSSGAVTSSPASLTIYQAAGIVTQPAGKTVANGAPAMFNVAASGFPTLSYQWKLSGTDLPGATATNLTINAVHLSDLGDYVVLVSNAYSSAQSLPATLSMSPSIITPFTGATGIQGQGSVLSVGAIGSGTLTYQWYKDGVAISGATNTTYSLPTLQQTDAGQYSVTVNSGFGSTTNSPAQVVVYPPAEISLGVYAGVTIQGTAGFSYVIQYSTNLVDPNAWIDATNIFLQQPVQIWSDYGSDVRANPKRYYRIKAAP